MQYLTEKHYPREIMALSKLFREKNLGITATICIISDVNPFMPRDLLDRCHMYACYFRKYLRNEAYIGKILEGSCCFGYA